MIENLWMMSIQSCVLILIVLLLRAVLHRYPKKYVYGLWALVLLRLLCPIFVESSLSLQPDLKGSELMQRAGQQTDMLPVQDPGVNMSGKEADTHTSQTTGQPNGAIVSAPPESKELSDPAESVIHTASVMDAVFFACRAVYLAGTVFTICVFLMQYLQIRRRVATAVRKTGNIYLCEHIDSPFVMGLIGPRIYLPYHVPEEEEHYILKHEKIHIRHRDTFVRALGILTCCLHWWNPLVWYAVHKMNQDMEMFCDETAMAHAPLAERKAYSAALLHFSMRRSGLAVALSFGESNTEKRVKNVLRKKQRSALVLAALCIVAIGCALAFLSVPEANAGKVPQSPPGGTEHPSTDLHQEEAEQWIEQFKAVLMGDSAFYSVDVKKELNITQLGEAITSDSEIAAEATRLAVMDLDGDDQPEVILRVGIGQGAYAYEVLRWLDGTVYGYTLPARGFMNLKKDGTFLFSGGAADNGYGAISFTENAYVIERITYSESAYDADNNWEITYYVDHEPTERGRFLEAISQQDAKLDVLWHDFLDFNIRRLMELETRREQARNYEETLGEQYGNNSDAGSSTDEAYYEMVTDFSKTEVEGFAREVREQLLTRDWAGLSEKIVYPITIAGTTYQNAQELLSGNPDEALTDEFLEKIRTESCENMFFNWQGIMMGETGQVWIAEVLDGNMESTGLKILSINAGS